MDYREITVSTKTYSNVNDNKRNIYNYATV